MKKNVIALSVTAAIAGFAGNALAITGDYAGAATAMAVSPGGVGHNLVVPYFSAQNGNDTYLNITNTDTVNGKAVKVRFRGAANSDDVFDFQVFLSPGDIWAAALTNDENGVARLVTSDKSCTLPKGISGRALITSRVDASLAEADKAVAVKEGYVEIITMANISPVGLGKAVATATLDGATNKLYQATKHNSAGTPTCADATLNLLVNNPVDVAAIGTSGSGYAAEDLGMTYPTASITASWAVVNVNNVVTWSGVANAMTAVDSAGAPTTGNLVFWPQTNVRVNTGTATTADLYTADALYISGGAAAATAGATATTAITGPIVQPLYWDLPDLSTPYTLTNATNAVTDPELQAEEVANLLAVTSVTNEYVIEGGIAAQTDWVMSMPTRRYAVAVDYGTATAFTARAVYNTELDTHFDFSNAKLSGRTVCVRGATVAEPGYWNREEGYVRTEIGFDVSPGVPDQANNEVPLCGEAAVLNFANLGGEGGTSPLSAAVAKNTLTLSSGYNAGWLTVNTPGLANAGLPIVGYAAVKAVNGPSNYGLTWGHRSGL